MGWLFGRKKNDSGTPATQADVFTAAVLAGDAAVVRSAIKAGVDVDSAGVNGTPPLVLAIVKGHEAVADLLMSAGADVNRPDPNGGMTALHAAALKNLNRTARELIGRRADVNASFGRPPMSALAVAFRGGNWELVRLLLGAGAKPDVTIATPGGPAEQAGTLPIHYAASVGDAAMLRLLVQRGSNPNAAKADGLTPLMAAAFNGQLEAVKILIEAGADPNIANRLDPGNPFSALDLAATQGHDPIVKYLAGRGAVSASKAPR